MPAPPRSDPAAAARLDAAALRHQGTRLLRQPQVPWLHEEAARRMADRLPLVKLQPASLLDWSGPLGGSTTLLQAAYPQAAHLRQVVPPVAGPAAPASQSPPSTGGWWPWRRRRGPQAEPVVAADVHAGDAELLWSNMLLQAVDDLPGLLGRWQQALAVDGFLMFSTLGPGSLTSLRALYQARGWGEPFAAFVDMHDLGDMLVQAGFADPVMDQELLTLSWPDGDAALRELRSLGGNVALSRHVGLRTPRWRRQLAQALVAGAPDGRPTLQFELVYGHAFKAAPRHRVAAQTAVPLDDMRSMVRQPRR